MIRCDLHVHTHYSHDSLLKPEHLVEACLRKGINCIAVTDHNEIEGARAVKRMAPFTVIIGEEIRTAEGEVTGLFLKERIPPFLSAEETVKRIKAQKGLVYIPHPFAAGVAMRLKRNVLERLLGYVDIIEGWNSRGILRTDDMKAQAFARMHRLPFAAGSDAHTRFEIGRAYVEMQAFRNKREFLERLGKGVLQGRKTALVHPFSSVMVGRAKVLAGHRTEAARERRRKKLVTRRVWIGDL
jgi:predicted metal-dependent phosphoesterase TrpH